MIRGNLLRPAHALIWLGTGTLFLLLVIFRQITHWLAALLQIEYPPAIMFLVGLLFLLSLLLNQSVLISTQTRKSKEMAQELAILRWRLEQLEHGSVPEAQSP